MKGAAIFPRGGKRTHIEDEDRQEFDLFKTKESVQPAAKKRKVVKTEKLSVYKHRNYSEVEKLHFQTLREGMVLLGRVKEVRPFKVTVSLPCAVIATLPITSISQVYTQHLQAVADSQNDDDTQDIPQLADLFKIGDGLPCHVVKTSIQDSKHFVDVSTDPQVVNKDLPVSALKKGCLLYGVVQSVEEHGCMMDVGVPGIKAFLMNSDSSQEVQRSVGAGMWCTVCSDSSVGGTSEETRVIKVTTDNVLDSVVTRQMVSSLECLRPGMKVKATVEKVLKDGLHVKCVKYKGCVYKIHVPKGLSQYKPGQEVEGRILYTNPSSKVVSISLLPGVLTCVQPDSDPFAGLSVGDIVDEAEVLFVDKANAVFFRLQSCTALAPLQHLSDDKIKDVHHAFPQGSKHRCRVIGFQPADDVVLISLKQSVLEQKILSMNDIHAGQIIECTVEAIVASGVTVKVSKGLTALIPKMHVADVPLKNFSKKFTKGDKLKCRVLKVDHQARKMILTKKKSLVTTTKMVPASYMDLKPDMQLEGFIIAVKDTGVAVAFCNDVRGWVPKRELSAVEIADPQTAFYQGQVVRCRVVFCHQQEQKLRLSFVLSGKASIASRAKKMEDFEPGKLLEAKATKKLSNSFEVELQPSGIRALLPREHLSDSLDNQVLLWRSIAVGESLGTVMLFKQTNLPIVTLKESFLSVAREGLTPKSVEDLQPGQLLPAVIKNHQSYGVFVELAGGLGGLAPCTLLMEQKVSDPSEVFASGQSVVVKVIEIKEEKGRFLCSLRLCDCYHDDPEVSVEMLETYLNERDHYLVNILDDKAKGLRTGSLVKAKVQQNSKDGYVCETDFGMPAIITRHHTGEAELEVGMEVEAVVLHIAVDQAGTCLELTADAAVVRDVSRRAEKPNMTKAAQGQTIKGQVALIKDDFVLVTLRQHAVGMMAFVPRRQHLNDVLANTTAHLAVGDEIRVTIQRCDGDQVLAVPDRVVKEVKAHPRHSLQLGQTVSAVVQSILPGQMNIKIGTVSGRVHVTEVLDEVKNGVFPFAKYSKGQEITAKIIGFRHFKSFKYLPLSRPRVNKALPDCTLKPSKLQTEGCPAEEQASHTVTYSPGDKVTVYSMKFEDNRLWVNVSPLQRGVISVFDLSRDLGVLKKAEKSFPGGHGYNATVTGVEREGLIHLSLTGKKEVVKVNKVVTGKVTSVSDKGLALRLPADFRGMVPAKEQNGDGWRHIALGSFLRCLVLCCKNKEGCVLSLNLTHRSEEELKRVKKRRRTLSNSEVTGEAAIPQTNSAERKTKRSTEETPVETKEIEERASPGKCLKVAAAFQWEQATQAQSDEDRDSDEEDEEDEEPAAKKRKGIPGAAAQSYDVISGDFEKRLLSSPNSSKLWIEYMCQQLNEGKTDVARSIGNRAVQTIALEEEQEKLNVWIALMNLENLYGSKEDLDKTFSRALEVTDPLKLFRRVAAMYTASGNMEQAEQIHKNMLRKFKQDRQVWIDYGLFLCKNGQLEAARKLLQRALLSLDRKDHVTTITQFASLECKYGEAERGFTMFDKTLVEFPKRLDVLTVYTDMAVLTGDMDKARVLFERAWTLKPSKRFFSKYLQFEEKHGTEETVARLRSRIEQETL